MAQLPGITQGAGENSWGSSQTAAGQRSGSAPRAQSRPAERTKSPATLPPQPYPHDCTRQICLLHVVAAEPSQKASRQVMPKITGTESNVATKIVSRAKITPRS